MAVGSLITCPNCSKVFARKLRESYCSVECRFWHKVEKRGPDDCWLWSGTKPAFGHGQFVHGGKVVYAHRFAWEQVNGHVPDGQCILHRCDVPSCVNPAHLFLGTRVDNLSDMRVKMRGRNPPRHAGSRHPQAKLTETDVRDIRTSSLSALELAHRYGIARRTVYNILHRKSWADLE